MAFTAFRDLNPWSQLIMGAFFILVSFLATLVLSVILAIPFFGLNEMLAALSAPDYSNQQTINILKYFQVFQSIGLFIVPPIIIAKLFEGDIIQYLKLNKKNKAITYLFAALALLAFNPFISIIGIYNTEMSFPESLSGLEQWMRTMEDSANDIIGYFMQVNTLGGLLFNIFMIALIPAIGEEFLFRGVVQKIFTNITHNYHWGIWITAILFSALHLQFFGFVPRVLLGALFGYMLVYSGSLWLPVLCHFLNNAIAVIALYAGNNGDEGLEQIANFEFEIGDSFIYMLPILLISLAATIFFLRSIRKVESIH